MRNDVKGLMETVYENYCEGQYKKVNYKREDN